MNCATWHCSQTRINTGFFANSAKFLSQAVRGRTGHAAFLPSARPGGCTPGKPPSCVPQGRKGHSKINGAHARHRPAQARASARRSVARLAPCGHAPRRDSGGTPLFLKRGSPFPRVRRLMIVLNKLREFPEEEGGCCGATGTQGPAGRQKRLYGLD